MAINQAAPSGAGTEVIDSMAMLGKTALSLLFIVALILLLSYLVKRLNSAKTGGSPLLRQIASASLGPKERVVVVEFKDTWLLLGVGGGQISKLHEIPAEAVAAAGAPPRDDFASRLSGMLSRGTPRDPSHGGSQS